MWKIDPFVAFGSLSFGSARGSIRSLLGSEFRSFKKTPSSPNDTDAYQAMGIQLYYDEDDKLDLVEAVIGRCDKVYLGETLISGLRLDDLVASFKAIGLAGIREVDGCDFPDAGISVSATDRVKVSSVAAFNRERFARLMEIKQRVAEKRARRAQERANGSGPPPMF